MLINHTNTEYNSLDIIKHMNPFLSFWSLSSGIKHSEEKIFVAEMNLHNSNWFDPSVQDVLQYRGLDGSCDDTIIQPEHLADSSLDQFFPIDLENNLQNRWVDILSIWRMYIDQNKLQPWNLSHLRNAACTPLSFQR